MATLVQHATGRTIAGASVSVAFPSNVTAGNTITACVGAFVNIVATDVTDTLGHTYVMDINFSPATGDRNAILRVSNILGGPCTVTYDPPNTDMALSIQEWSGMAASPLDGTGSGFKSAAQSDTHPITSSFSAGGAGIVLGSLGFESAGSITITPGATYTQIDELETNDWPYGVEYKAVVAGTYTADWTITDHAWSCVAAAYLDVSGPVRQVLAGLSVMMG